MKNNNGQVLVMFLILLPMLLMLGALVIDTGIVLNKKLQINNAISKDIEIAKIEKDLENNEIKIKSIEEKENCVIIKSSVESVFGKIIGKNEYLIIIEKCK